MKPRIDSSTHEIYPTEESIHPPETMQNQVESLSHAIRRGPYLWGARQRDGGTYVTAGLDVGQKHFMS